MSELTALLLGTSAKGRANARWRERLDGAADLLVREYGVPSLGNFRDPVREIFYIALSARTTEAQYQRIHRSLFRRFGCLRAIARAPASSIRRCIAEGGLANKRAAQLKAIATRLLRLGPHPVPALRKMSPSEAFAFLTSLPGVGPKSALCVMMYSLGMDVFPVDVHVNRICSRLGAIPRHLKHYRAQQLLPARVPAGRSKELHIGLVLHGRKVCTPRRRACTMCVLAGICKMRKAEGVADG